MKTALEWIIFILIDKNAGIWDAGIDADAVAIVFIAAGATIAAAAAAAFHIKNFSLRLESRNLPIDNF